ncbi:MAG: tRNA (adenosine(37)-N6)-threonylcarbamoyltransferase complex transferase subunit TsaD [Bacteroidetes bacterium]|nr:tRNA (adenosine(37)-N6)-threonylcarbamoyltransferase complex transferase subunit TsaD [Bacteroidota bacterium]
MPDREPTVYILAIESSCDDTAAAVLQNATVLSNVVADQKIHQAFGGVVPELASRAHQQNIVPVVHQALAQAGIDKNQLHAIAFTKGPGLLGSLLVGMSFAKSLSQALKIPLIEVNHMQGHILAHFIDDKNKIKPTFPFLALTVSGGHTQLIRVDDYFNMTVLGQSKDDAVGEAFDKSAKLLGLPYPGGPLIDKYAQTGNPYRFTFTKPKMDGFDYSFSGIKTAILNFIHKEKVKNPDFIEENLADICASIQHTLIEILFDKLVLAVQQTGITKVAVGGGVSANSALRRKLEAYSKDKNWTIYIPDFEYTTDNAAMIGIVGYLKFLKNDFTDESISSTAKYPL